MNIKLIAFDMDGTLLDSTKQVRESSKRAIAAARAAGCEVAVASGRGASMLEHNAKGLEDIRYAITASGAVTYDRQEKKVMSTSPIPPDVIRAVASACEGENLVVNVFLGSEFYYDPKDLKHFYERGLDIFVPLFEDMGIPAENGMDLIRHPFAGYDKLDLHFGTFEARGRAIGRMREMGLPLALVDGESSSLEVTLEGVSKASGLRALTEHLGIPLEQTVAVGDSYNDLEILRTAGVGIAMGNAVPAALEAADAIVASNDNDGIVEAIERFVLGHAVSRVDWRAPQATDTTSTPKER